MIYSFVLISLLATMQFKVQPYEHEVPGPLSNKEYMHTFSQWLESCTGSTHPQCNSYRRQHDRRLSRPSRLLYYPRNQTERVQLVEVQMGQIYQYATLSHRWGTPEPLKLSCNSDGHRKISYNAMIKGVPTSDLPRIFREALQIIQHCKLEYLWIDSLCINQDSDNDGMKLEWEHEAVKIGDIYTGGVFNIAAIGSKNSDDRLFPEERIFFAPVVRDYFNPHGQHEWGSRLVGILPDFRAEFERQVSSSELLTRGWVYQEVILAPANLFCTAQQMWWLCHTGRYCQNHMITSQPGPGNWQYEDMTLSQGRKAIANPSGDPGSLKLWGELLRLYIKTSVTFEDDRLAAIAGLSKVFQSAFPKCVERDCYNSGFWSTNIVFQLGWRTVSSKVALNRYTTNPLIPSWSPVSCKSEIDYAIYHEANQLPIKWVMNTSGLDSFGRAKSIEQCILHLRGVPIEVTLGPAKRATKVEYEIWPLSHPDLRFEVRWDNEAEIDLAAKGSLNIGCNALILHALHSPERSSLGGILLRPFRDDGLTTPNKWVRCGYLTHSSHYKHGWLSMVLQFSRYGIKWEDFYFFDPRRVSTGSAPDLEDIYLV